MGPASLSFPAAGGQANVNVTVTGGCSWSPVAGDSWITASPSGNQVSIGVAANPAAARSGLVHVRGAVVVVSQATVPNLLQNPGFDSGLAFWSEAFSHEGSATVSQSSPVASPGPSPSAALIISSAGPVYGHQLSQCVNVTGGKTYESGTRVLIPSGQSAGNINFAVYDYWVPDCTASVGYQNRHILSAYQPTGSWFDESVTWTPSYDAKSVLVVIGAGASTDPSFSAWFDDLYLREKP